MRPVLLVVCALFLTSCFNQGDCLTTATNLVKISILNKDGATEKQTQFLRITNLEENVEFLRGDSTYTGTTIELPLNPSRLQTSFELLTSDSVTLKMGFTYRTYTRVIAVDCGAFLYYENLAIDTAATRGVVVKLINSKLFTGVTTNAEIYY